MPVRVLHRATTGERERVDFVEIGSQRDLFDVPPEVAYFNTANTSPMLRSAREAGIAALGRRAEPWRIASCRLVHRRRASAGRVCPDRRGRARRRRARSGDELRTGHRRAQHRRDRRRPGRRPRRGVSVWLLHLAPLLPADRRGAPHRPRGGDTTWADAVARAARRAHAGGRGSARALDRWVVGRPRCGGRGRAPLRGGGDHRREPVARRAAARRVSRCGRISSCPSVTSGFSARSGSAASTSTSATAAANPSRRTGSIGPGRRISPRWSTTRTLPPRRATLRRGRANELRARADGDRRCRAAARVDDPGDRGEPASVTDQIAEHATSLGY